MGPRSHFAAFAVFIYNNLTSNGIDVHCCLKGMVVALFSVASQEMFEKVYKFLYSFVSQKLSFIPQQVLTRRFLGKAQLPPLAHAQRLLYVTICHMEMGG